MSSGRLRVLTYLIVAWIGFSVTGVNQPAHAETLIESGIQNLNYKRYWSAQADFQKAVDQNPQDQKAYYYLGMTLERLKDRDNAKAAYRACYGLNPFSEHGQKARRALLDVSEKIESNANRAVDTPETVAKTGILIQRQSMELQERKLREARGHANFRMQQGRYYSSRNYPNHQLYNPASNYTGYNPAAMGVGNINQPNPYNQIFNRNPNDEISNARFIQDSHMLYDSANEATKMRAHGAKTAASVQDFSNGLIERLGRKKDDVPLRALGTSLYVQYYRSAEEEEDTPPPPDGPLELRARQMKYQYEDPVFPKAEKKPVELRAKEKSLH